MRIRILKLIFLLSIFLTVASPFAAFAGLESVLSSSSIKRVGIYPGTFDPPHIGHESILREAIRQLDLDILIVIPNFNPVHKKDALSFEDRLEMTQAAFGDFPRVVVADAPLARELSQQPLANAVNQLAADHPFMQIVEIVGSDVFDNLRNKSPHFGPNVSLAVGRRSSLELALPEQVGGAQVVELDIDAGGWSSTKIRNRIASGQEPVAGELRPEVAEIIHRIRAYLGDSNRCEMLWQ